jgi:hypothetical protein
MPKLTLQQNLAIALIYVSCLSGISYIDLPESTSGTFFHHTPNPTTVTIAGSLQSELGCPGDWDPACAITHITYDATDDVWQGTFMIPAGNWEYKAAINNSWDENYGLNAQPNGPNIPLNLPMVTAVKFYYDHKTHWITDNVSSRIVTAPGSYQSEIGCPGDWQPDCLRSWLQDPDGDGIFTFSTSGIPPGNYEAKAAINESFTENYGAGGAANGPNIPFTVSSLSSTVLFSFNSVTNVLTINECMTCYADMDMDGFGDPNNSMVFCPACPSGYSTDASDCDDTNASVNPSTALGCRDLNLSLQADGLVQFMVGEIATASSCDPLDVMIRLPGGPIIFQASGLTLQDLVTFDGCAYQDRELVAMLSYASGLSCQGRITLHQNSGPVFQRGRKITVFCTDPLVGTGDILNIKPKAEIPCSGAADVRFVTDWIQAYTCDSDTAKVILREYEAFDKLGRRAVVLDTIVVVKLPQLVNVTLGSNLRNIGCAESDTLYCGENERTDPLTGYTPVGPYLLVEEFPGFPAIDLDMDGIGCDTIWFCAFKDGELISLFDDEDKCGLQVHKEIKTFGGLCNRQYKITIELKQTCSKTPLPLDCFVPGADQNIETIGEGYYRCEFWISDLDTLPPLFAPKIFDEFSCLTVDTSFLGGSDLGFLDIFQPVVFTNEHDCAAYSYLPPLCVFDDWSGVKLAKATVEGGGTYILENEGERCFLLPLGDDGELVSLRDLAALLGEELDEILNDSIIDFLDSLGILKEGSCYRSHEKIKLTKSEKPIRIFYEVYDSCHLIERDTAYIHVKDGTPPVAVADKGVTVSLSDKKVWVDAAEFDEGSWDNCGVNVILARRSDWREACVDLCYNKQGDHCDPDSVQSALCWLWTDGHDTLWTLDLEGDKDCDEVEAYYKKQLDWFCEDETPCGRLIYNSWLYDLIKYATVTCKSNDHLDDQRFDQLFYRAVGNPQHGDMIRIKNEDFLNLIDTVLGGIIRDSILMGKDIILLDSVSGLFDFYGVDVFKCQEFSSVICGGLEGGLEELFVQILFQLFLENCFPFFVPGGPDLDLFIPAIFPEDFKQDLFSQWKNIGGGWSDAVPFSCDDACSPVTVEILVMDYWCNWSTAWTKVWVEDKTPVKVVKDVSEQEAITCKVYKENNYSYPGEDHPVSLEYIVEQAKVGTPEALDALDGIFGGYQKAWVDPYGHYVDSNGEEIEGSIPFYDSICDCKKEWKQIRVYDEHLGYLWVDSLVTECYYEADTLEFWNGIVAVNCAENVYCEQEVWCEFDHCGQGYIFRKFKIWQGCPEGSYEGWPDSLRHAADTIYRHQRIWVGNECELSKYMFDRPYDTEVYTCNIEYGADGNVIGDAGPENTGYPVYQFDDDCRIVGIAHEDKVFKIVGGDAACYKILRTWYFADWCGYGGDRPVGKWWLDDGLVIDRYVQQIIVIDTVVPRCVLTGPVQTGGTVETGACEYELVVTVDASDACGLTSYYWELKDFSDPDDGLFIDSGNGSLSGEEETAFDIVVAGLAPGTYKLLVTLRDECNNESYCEYTVVIQAGKKPTPVCISSLTARLTPWDSDNDGEIDTAHAVVWAYEFDRSSTPACGDDSLEYRIEFVDGTDDDETPAGDLDYLDLGCAHIGTRLVRMWVISHPSLTSDYCDVVLVVQSDFTGCVPTAGGGDVMTYEENMTHPANRPTLDRMSGDPDGLHIAGDAGLPGGWNASGFTLEQNQPNPFRYETVIGFTLPEAMEARLQVFDVTGRLLKTVAGDFPKGYSKVTIDRDDLRNTGVLYYQLETKDYLATRKMVLLE